jgi:hypothetical protein
VGTHHAPRGNFLETHSVRGATRLHGGIVAPYHARWGCVPPGTGPGACSRADWDKYGVIDFNDFLAFMNLCTAGC